MVRKYFKVFATRYPPYYPINSSYSVVEHIYAASEEAARNAFDKYHRKGFGSYTINDCKEIDKAEFKGQHYFE